LQQVFLNILNNAYDAVQESGHRGRIGIRTRLRGDSIEVAVTDNGTGISDPERIFDPFYTTSKPVKATGLPKHLLRHRTRPWRRNPLLE